MTEGAVIRDKGSIYVQPKNLDWGVFRGRCCFF